MDLSFASVLSDLMRFSGAAPEGLLPFLARRELERQQNQDRLGVPIPRFCMLSVTWQCNLRCAGCYASNYQRKQPLSVDEIDRVARETAEAGTFLFIVVGGEPLIVPGLLERLAGNKQALFLLYTNGTLLNEATADRIVAAGNLFPMLSVDGDEACTDARRGMGVFRKVEEAMARLSARNAPFGFCSVITHANVRSVTSRAWFDRMWQHGARFGTLIDYIPFPHSLDPGLVLTEDDLRLRDAAITDRYREARPLVVNFPGHEYAAGECGAAGNVFMHINADGYVEPCPFSHFAADNVRDKSIVEILRSPFFCALRERTSRWVGQERTHEQCLLFAHRNEVATLAQEMGALDTESCLATTRVAPTEV